MADTNIEWTDKVWNPVRGCSRVSPGCDNCYAMRMARRSDVPGGAYEGLTVLRPKSAKRPGVDWHGVARLIRDKLAEPLSWRKPRRVFVNSMSDLFHESLAFAEIAAVFGIMGVARKHTFQVLTKRPKRAAEFFSWLAQQREDADLTCQRYARRSIIEPYLFPLHPIKETHQKWPWPYLNVHLGVSAENQDTYNERVPALVHKCQAAVYWASLEPLLGPIDLRGTGHIIHLNWIVVGGESGNGARPFDIQWAESLLAQCRESDIAFYMKQMGTARHLRWTQFGQLERSPFDTSDQQTLLRIAQTKGKDPSVWPEHLQVREFPVGR